MIKNVHCVAYPFDILDLFGNFMEQFFQNGKVPGIFLGFGKMSKSRNEKLLETVSKQVC